MQLRPALRAYAHAPAGVEEVFTPESITGLLLWLDPSDASTITTTSGAPGTLGEDITAAVDKAASKSFVSSYYPYTYNTRAGFGNGLPLFLRKSGIGISGMKFTPSSSPYNLVNGAGSVGIDEDWLYFTVIVTTASTAQAWNTFKRGNYASYPGAIYSPTTWHWTSPGVTSNIRTAGDWEDSSTEASIYWLGGDSPPFQDTLSKTSVMFLQSYDNGGTRTMRVSQNGSTWFSWAHGATGQTGTVASASNVWEMATYDQAIGEDFNGLAECGVYNAAVSDADIASLYSYLDDKWSLDI